MRWRVDEGSGERLDKLGSDGLQLTGDARQLWRQTHSRAGSSEEIAATARANEAVANGSEIAGRPSPEAQARDGAGDVGRALQGVAQIGAQALLVGEVSQRVEARVDAGDVAQRTG